MLLFANYDDFRHYYDGFMTTFLSDSGHTDRLTIFLVKNDQEKTTSNLKIFSSIFQYKSRQVSSNQLFTLNLSYQHCKSLIFL